MDQDKKLNEMIENVNKLKADVVAMQETIKDILAGQKEIEKLLKQVEKIM